MTHPYQPDPSRGAVAVNDDERTWAVLGHISTIVAAVLSVGWLSFLGPLIWADLQGQERLRPTVRRRCLQLQLLIWAMTTVAGSSSSP